MLPLDKLTEQARCAFADHDCNPEAFDAVLVLDMDLSGDFGRTWLALDRIRKCVYRFCENDGAFAQFSLALTAEPYVDNFTSSNRLLAHEHQVPAPPKGELDDKAYEKSCEEWRREGKTVTIAYCTNACKRKHFAFVYLWERYAAGQEVGEDDPIFEQFNAKCPKCGTVYADQQRRICAHCIKKSATMFRLLAYFKPFKLQFITVMLCLVASAAISLLTPIISNQIFYDQVVAPPKFIDGVQIQGKLHEIKWVYIMVGILFGMAVLSLVIGIIQNRANAYMSTRVTKNMKNDLFRALQHLSLSYFNQNPTGRLINRVNYDAVKIRSFYIDGVPHFIVNMLNFIGLTVFLFSLNWKLTLIVYIPVPIVVCMFKFMLPKLWRMYSKQWRRSSSLNAMLGDSLNGIRVVKAFAKEAEETNRFYQYSEKLYHANLQTNLVHLTIFPVISLLIGISSQAIWGFGGILVMDEYMTYGQFATYLGYIGMIFGPLNFFTNFTNMLTDTINSAVRMFETLDMIPEITDAPNAVELDSIGGDIIFDRVGFHYNPNRPILKDVSFTIHAGDHVGLVGHTGSGKSTIANLITRMYDVISGSISIDGHNVKDIKVDSLRRNIAIVSQEIYLFHGTIADNIRYARPDASMAEVIDAARAANAHDFILRLPEGYETMVGIGSRSLSGGERQRISIARALLMKPSLLILDEATAAMDTETERLISDAIDKLIEGRTTITIAHRLSTLKNCNYLMAIEHGEIAEQGTAEELMEKKGVYYKLYTLQNEQMKKVMAGL